MKMDLMFVMGLLCGGACSIVAMDRGLISGFEVMDGMEGDDDNGNDY